MVWTIMSIDTTAPLPAHLTSTSYLVLGLIEREGPSTPYELKRHVAATIGHFWSFPHALLYKEPARLVELGLLTEEREADGRRRRLFTITGRGRAAIRAWLATPSQEPTELRDAGLLQLFFADLGSADDRRALAVTTRPGKTLAAKSRRAGEFRLPRLSGREPGCRHLRVSA
jgi:PadR family transcriptional regulator AphA